MVPALLKPPLTAGAPRWYVAIELGVIAVLWFGLGVMHPATIILIVVLLFGIHPQITKRCREDPWALDIFLAYLRRPVVYDSSPALGATASPYFKSVPKV